MDGMMHGEGRESSFWTKKYLDELSYEIIGCAIEVNKEMGPGLLESVYAECMLIELEMRKLKCICERSFPMDYKGRPLKSKLRIDILVEDAIVAELKAVESISILHQSQLLTYLKLAKKPKGILLNFNCTNLFQHGQKTLVNNLYAALPQE